MWEHLPYKRYVISEPEPGILSMDVCYSIPVDVFVNMKTGELKLYGKVFTERIGIINILKDLNKE